MATHFDSSCSPANNLLHIIKLDDVRKNEKSQNDFEQFKHVITS
jgi:hypothetical protein